MVSKERVEDYLNKTKRALNKIKITPPDKTHNLKIAEDFLKMAESYYSDAVHFYEQRDLDDAFACVNYAHGWLDAGARLGLFDTGGDDQLFTLAD
ncbi:MAG: DUF357 domain-containing protein [Thermoplasmatota archaeon]